MGVKIRKRGSKWYVYVNYHGRRKNRCVGTREAAERVRREIEARLALGDQTFLTDGGRAVPALQRASWRLTQRSSASPPRREVTNNCCDCM